MKYFVLAIALSVSTCMTSQEEWSVILRPSLHIPTQQVLEEPLRIGNGIDLTAMRELNEQIAVYGGFVWNRFDRDQDYREDDVEYTQSGFVLGGLYFFYLFEEQEYPFYMRAGVQIMDVSTKSPNTSLNVEANWSVGGQFGLGMKIKSFDRFHILPELRYNTISNGYSINGNNRSLTFSSIAITGGISYTFN